MVEVLATMKYPQAVWMPGPPDKQGYTDIVINQCAGIVNHSMVGRFDDAIARLRSTDRASWHFSIDKQGRVFQHYEVEAVCWHAGTPRANGRLIGCEHEGGPEGNVSEPLTAPQLAASIALTQWLARTKGFPLELRKGLWEHNWLSTTACPSSRIPWEFYVQEDEMTQQDKDEIVKRINDHTDMKFLQLIVYLVNTGVKCKE